MSSLFENIKPASGWTDGCVPGSGNGLKRACLSLDLQKKLRIS